MHGFHFIQFQFTLLTASTTHQFLDLRSMTFHFINYLNQKPIRLVFKCLLFTLHNLNLSYSLFLSISKTNFSIINLFLLLGLNLFESKEFQHLTLDFQSNHVHF